MSDDLWKIAKEFESKARTKGDLFASVVIYECGEYASISVNSPPAGSGFVSGHSMTPCEFRQKAKAYIAK